MPDQYQLDPFLTAKAQAEARRQEAIREGHEAFNRAYLVEKARHAAEYERAAAAWNGVKSNPNAKGHEKAREEFELAKLPANHDSARVELNRAIRAADEAYKAEVARLGQEHGVLVR
jgi:hypothetical protein